MGTIRRALFLVTLALLTTQCSVFRKGVSEQTGEKFTSLEALCDSLPRHQRYMIRDVETEVEFRDEKYQAKLNLFIQQDSLYFLNAVNTGFEIFRTGVFPDSLVIIDRTDKVVIIRKPDSIPGRELITFQDLSLLLDRSAICEIRELLELGEGTLTYDYSTQDIKRTIHYNNTDLSVASFEYFNKKSGEYIVGERSHEESWEIFSNYLLGPMTILCKSGELKTERFPKISLTYNKAKYSVIYP